MSTITRTQIANVAAIAHGPWLMHLQPHDRIRVLSALATVYSCLGFVRKEVYVLREVLSVVMDLIVSAREEMREGLTSAISPGGSPGTAPAQISIREHEFGDGNESVVRLVRHICAVYGIDLGAVRLLRKVQPLLTNGMDGEEEKMEGDFDEDAEMDIARPSPFGWAELQVVVVQEAVAIAEALPGKLSHSSTRGYYDKFPQTMLRLPNSPYQHCGHCTITSLLRSSNIYITPHCEPFKSQDGEEKNPSSSSGVLDQSSA